MCAREPSHTSMGLHATRELPVSQPQDCPANGDIGRVCEPGHPSQGPPFKPLESPHLKPLQPTLEPYSPHLKPLGSQSSGSHQA